MKKIYNDLVSVYFCALNPAYQNYKFRFSYLLNAGITLSSDHLLPFNLSLGAIYPAGKLKDYWKTIILTAAMMTMLSARGQNVSATWGANGSSPWYTGGNWSGGLYAGSQGAASPNTNVATFTNAFTAFTVGINMTTASLNLGAVAIDNTRTTSLSIGNSGGTAGFLRLYGSTVNGISNVIIRNNGSGPFILQATQSGTMGVVLGNAADNVINTDGSGSVTILSILSGTGPLTKAGSGTGVLTLANSGNTYVGKTTANSGLINVPDEAAFGPNPGGFVANQVTLNGGGIQATGNLIFGSNRGITLGASGGVFDVSGGFSISIQNTLAGSGDLSKSGAGTLRLNNAGGNTIPAANNVTVNAGTLQISTNQTLNNLSLISGNMTLDNGVTLTVNGVLDYFQAAAITLGTGSKIVYGPSGTLKYSGATARTAAIEEWPNAAGSVNVIINNAGGITLPTALAGRTITGNLTLAGGTFTIGANVVLNLDGASLTDGGGFLAGNSINGSTADFTVMGTTGGTVTIPTNNLTVGLRNVTVAGTRVLALNGTNNLNLSGTLSVGANATFDNGGESQVTDGGTPVISITGTFVSRDMQGFYGSNTSIPGIVPTLNTNSTVEYGLATGSTQAVTSTSTLGQAYYNITFSGSGTKTLSNLIDVNANGTVKITGNLVTVDASTNNLASTGTISTNFTMDGGLLIIGTGNTQPNMDGTYNLTGGTIRFSGASNTKIRSKTYQNIEVTGSDVSNSGGNITLNNLGTFTIKNGGVFTINADAIVGTATSSVTVESGGVFKCGNGLGFNGPAVGLNSPSIRNNVGTIILQPNSLVEYSRSNPRW